MCLTAFSTSKAWKLPELIKRRMKGNGTVIAILDAEVNPSKYDALKKKNNITYCNMLVTDDPDTKKTDHGAACAVIAAGLPDIPHEFPGGVAPDASLIMYRIVKDKLSVNRAVLRALDDVKATIEKKDKFIDVVSISVDFKEEIEEEVKKKINQLTKLGVVFVASAGNRGGYQSKACIPARFSNVISVGALDKNGRKADFNPDVKIDAFAPGDDIVLQSDEISGTSYATPAIAGLVCLLKESAKKIGGDALSNKLTKFEVLKYIFDNYISTLTDAYEEVRVFDPVEFLKKVNDDPTYFPQIIDRAIAECSTI